MKNSTIKFVISSKIVNEILYFNFYIDVDGIRFPLQVKGDYLSSRILFQMLNINDDCLQLGDGEELIYEK